MERKELLALMVRAADVGFNHGQAGLPHEELAREVEARLGHELADSDETAFKKALELVRQRIPDATEVTFETSDQNYYGFTLRGHNGTPAPEGQDGELPALLDLEIALWDHLCNLRWDGVVGEGELGRATWNLVTGEKVAAA